MRSLTGPGVLIANPDHPLNRQRLLWLLCLPHNRFGAKWQDVSGRGNHGALTKMTSTAASGWRGISRPGGWGSLQFDGVDDYAGLSDAGFPFGAAARSVGCWFNVPSALTANDHYFFAYGTNTALNGYLLGVFQEKLFVYDVSHIVQSAATVNDGKWHHGMATYDGTTHRLYLDGVLVNSQAATLNTPQTGAANVGKTVQAFGSNFITGMLDSVSLWSRALSAAEVAAELAAGMQPLYSGALMRVNPAMMAAYRVYGLLLARRRAMLRS